LTAPTLPATSVVFLSNYLNVLNVSKHNDSRSWACGQQHGNLAAPACPDLECSGLP
jgi:hypothetical protein